MNRRVKIFCSGVDQEKVAQRYRILASYDAFVLVEVPKKELKLLSRKYPVEDITSLFRIRAGERTVDTTHPRIDSMGRVHPHPVYRGAKPLSPGRHHYLVQLIGPIKSAWLSRVKKAHGELRAPYGDFTYVVRAKDKALPQIAALPFVHWIGHLPHSSHLSHQLVAKLTSSAIPNSPFRPAPNWPSTGCQPGSTLK